jgi:hypothetical protein
MNLKDYLYGDEWPDATCEELVATVISDTGGIQECVDKFAEMFGRLLDELPLSDKQKFEIIGSRRWELK